MQPYNKKPPRRVYHFRRQLGGVVEHAKTRSNIHTLVVRINIFHPVCRSIFGRNHNATHRICCGLVVAAIGVVIAKWMGHSPNEYVSHAGDFGGYALHGLGLTPLIEKISEAFGGVVE